jgi:NAD(P)H-dependent FMN reductase
VNIVVISCSLHPFSRSHVLARQVVKDLEALDADVQFFDLRRYKLRLADVGSARDTSEADTLREAIRSASAVIIASPIYNFDVNAAAKNLVELTGSAWENKLVGFVCVAGGRSSYMSVMGLANSLMLDFRCLIVPRFVYATSDAFDNDRTKQMTIGSAEIRERLAELAETTVQLALALESAGISSA